MDLLVVNFSNILSPTPILIISTELANYFFDLLPADGALLTIPAEHGTGNDW